MNAVSYLWVEWRMNRFFVVLLVMLPGMAPANAESAGETGRLVLG